MADMDSAHDASHRHPVLKALAIAAGVLTLCVLTVALAFYWNPIAFTDAQIRLHLWRQHVSSQYIQAGPYRMHYFEALPPAGAPGEPLLLIHGLGSRGEDWSAMIPTLAAHGFHVYAPDLPGYGRSTKPDADYSIRMQEQAVLDFMQAIHLQHADVGGWSMGGWIALKLAVDHPAVVDRLVVYDAAGIYFPATFNASLFTPTDPAGVQKLLNILSPHPKTLPGFGARAAVRKLQANAWVLDRSVDSMIGGRDLLDFQLHTITRPTLLVWGAQDRLIPPSVGESMHRKISGSSLLLVDDCGHLAPAECSRPILRATIKFLQAQPSMPPYERTVPGH